MNKNGKEETPGGPHSSQLGQFHMESSSSKSDRTDGDRELIITVKNEIQDTALIKQKNGTKDGNNPEVKTSCLMKEASKIKTQAVGNSQNQKPFISTSKSKHGDIMLIETEHTVTQNTKHVQRESFMKELEQPKKMPSITSAKLVRSNLLRKISLSESFKGKLRVKSKQSSFKKIKKERSNRISDVSSNSATDLEIAEQKHMIDGPETQSNATESDPGNKISSVASDTITDQNSDVSLKTDKTNEGTVNGSCFDKDEDQPRNRKRTFGSRMSSMKQAKKYESLLKIVTGSSFKTSSFYK